MTDHLCPVQATNGAVDPSWCFDHYADVLLEMPTISRNEEDVRVPELQLWTNDESWSVYYCPFDWVNPAAKVVLVGITPGLQQSHLANREAQKALREGASHDEALRRACNTGSFAGRTRTNLVNMLNEIGLQTHLGVSTAATLFSRHDHLLHSTSSLMYPVFRNGKNYSGSQKISQYPVLCQLRDTLLVTELNLVPDALVVPLGENVNEILLAACERGVLDRTRVLVDFPHPSGNNGHRLEFFTERKTSLVEQVRAWAASA